MKVRDYKTLLSTDRRAAMLFDLTERFPRGPEGKLRADDYKDGDGIVLANGWGSSTSPYLNRGVETAENSPMTGGWNPREIFELEDGEWRLQSILSALEVPAGTGMGCDYYVSEGQQKLFKNGAQLTRRARRASARIRHAKKWVEENITRAIYSVNMGYGMEDVHVHGDSETGATTQYEMFLKAGVSACPGYREDRAYVSYVRPATDPTALLTLNDKFVKSAAAGIADRKKRIETMLKEIEGLEAAKDLVYSYSINMAATFGVDDEDDCDE